MDVVETINGSIVQHGPHNDRIYVMRWNSADTHNLIATLDDMALTNGYGKIFAKIPASEWHAFKSADYIREAVIPGFFKGKTDGFFISKYFSPGRQKARTDHRLLRFVNQNGGESAENKPGAGKATRDVVSCRPSDVEEMSAVYRQVFKSYPFPIQEPLYLKHVMKEGVLYFGIRVEGKIAALAAAEIDLASQNAEMTDFATLPEWRGTGFQTVSH